MELVACHMANGERRGLVGLSAHGGRRGVHCGLAAAAHAGHLKLRIAALTCFVLAPGKAHETWQKRLQRVHPISGTLLR